MHEIVKENLKRAQSKQKRLYDSHSSQRRLEVGDKAVVLLLSPPYTVTKASKNGLNYVLDTGKVRKQHHIYHINLLSK